MRVIKRGKRFSLAFKARHAGGVAGKTCGQNLESHIAPELSIGRAPDLAHAAFTELGDDLVVGD